MEGSMLSAGEPNRMDQCGRSAAAAESPSDQCHPGTCRQPTQPTRCVAAPSVPYGDTCAAANVRPPLPATRYARGKPRWLHLAARLSTGPLQQCARRRPQVPMKSSSGQHDGRARLVSEGLRSKGSWEPSLRATLQAAIRCCVPSARVRRRPCPGPACNGRFVWDRTGMARGSRGGRGHPCKVPTPARAAVLQRCARASVLAAASQPATVGGRGSRTGIDSAALDLAQVRREVLRR
jgi:hypothetical protein